MKTVIKTLVAGFTGAGLVAAGVAYSGLVNVGADDPHLPGVRAFLSMARDRSIEVRARNIQVPDLKDPALLRSGAGNYNAMCIGCHLAPGLEKTELSQGLYPAPPNLSRRGTDGQPAATFWVIKHGIKASGMPAWGHSMGDPYIWGLVAFIQQLPELDAQGYQQLVAASGGHQHGGGEDDMHGHGSHHDAQPTGSRVSGSDAGEPQAADAVQPPSSGTVHIHADGKEHHHAH